MDKNEYRDWLKLNSIKNLGSKTIQRLLSDLGKPNNFLGNDSVKLRSINYISQNIKEEIVANKDNDFIEQQLQYLEEYDVRLISILDDEYPKLLKYIHQAPILLYIKGEILPEDENCFAIVGTRNPTNYGKLVAKEISCGLADAGFTIVSGLAFGIDKIAHLGALERGGRTIAVFGTGLDTVYPTSHRKIAEKIVNSGAIISEYGLKEKIEKWNFATRNRIISGMSKGTLVVEGAKTSGALITAKLALDQNRDVFAIPGNINNPKSEGPNFLIKIGAKIVTNINDILEEYQTIIKYKKEEVPELDSDELIIFDMLRENERELYFNQMIEMTQLSVPKLSVILTNLELKGIVKRESANKFLLI